MPLTLIFGEAGTGKSEYCLSAMQELFARGTTSLMIVPEQFAHAAESRLVEKNGFISEEILAVSFQRLAFRLLKKNGKIKNAVSRVGKSMLLSGAVLESENGLSLYKDAAAKPGFIDAMLTFISECKRSEITPEMLSAVTETENPYLSMKIKELSLIYSAYQAHLVKEFTDTEDYLPQMASIIRQTKCFSGTCIFIDEFFRFTPAELDCIQALFESGAEVYVALGANPSAGGVFAPVTQTAKRLNELAKEAGATIHPPIVLKEKHRFASSPELLHFEKEYHHYPPTIYKEETHDISLYIAPDPYTEVQILAANICRLVREKGLRFRDIAIIAGTPENYDDLIQTVFPVYGIPIFLDRKRSLLAHPIMILFSSLLRLMSDGFRTELLMTYIKTGYAGLTLNEADALENYALAGRLKPQDWTDDVRFLKHADSVFNPDEEYDADESKKAQFMLSLRDKVMAPLLALKHNLNENRLVSHRAEALFRYFESIQLHQKVEKETKRMVAQGRHQQAEEHGEIYNLLITLLDELVTCLGDKKIGLKRLESIITAGLSQCEMSTIPPSADQVFLGDSGRSLVKNVKALFVIGAVFGTFPDAPPNEGLIKDSERICLEKLGLSLGPDGKKIAFQNQYLVYSALNISSGCLFVSYPVADQEGKGLLPSPFIKRLFKLFPALSVTDNLTAPPAAEAFIAGKASAWQYVLEHFNDSDEVASALKTFFADDSDFAARYAATLRYSAYRHQVNDLSHDVAKALYGTNLHTSITKLERFSSCPFAYFLQYGLKARERKILKIDAPDVGQLLHKLVELGTQKIVEKKLSYASLQSDVIKSLAEETVTELFSTLFIRHLYTENRLDALIRRLKMQLTKLLSMIVTHIQKGEFEPCAFEVAFDENGLLPPVVINLPTGESITVTGRIDRIDTLARDAEVYIKIIDYKSGNKSFRLRDVYNRLSLQLAVYLIAASDAPAFGANPKPAGLFYFRLADERVSATEKNTDAALLKQFKMKGLVLNDADIVRAMDKGISGHSAILPARMNNDGSLSKSGGNYATLTQFNRLKAYVRRIVGEIGREILSGSAAVSPCKTDGNFPCEHCRYHPVCAFRADRDAYRTAAPLKDDAVWALLSDGDGNHS